MSLDVLTPVAPRRRRRRRYRLRRLVPLAILAAAALVAGVLLGWHGTAARTAHRVPPKPHGFHNRPVARTVATAPPKPLVLLHGPPLLNGQLRGRLLSPEAILVDARTGRILWEKRAHQRRAIASTTKIMTALLALR